MTAERTNLELGIPGFRFGDLHDSARLAELLDAFDEALRVTDPSLCDRLMAYRGCRGEGMAPQAVSTLITDVAPHLSTFVARLFGIQQERELLARELASRQVIFEFKARFLRERVGKSLNAAVTILSTWGKEHQARLASTAGGRDDVGTPALAEA